MCVKKLRQSPLLVTGATGFLGGFLVRELARRGYDNVRCLVRPDSDTVRLIELGFQVRVGDLGDLDSMVAALDGIEGIINLASLGFGHAPKIATACGQAALVKGVFVSTTAIFTTLPAKTKAIRLEAERHIGGLPFASTILRPSMIYGSRDDRNIYRLVNYLRKYPFIPIFGSGKHLQQPVYVGDVARAVVDAYETRSTDNKVYDIPGAKPLSYNELIDATCEFLRRRVIKIHIPQSLSLSLVRFYSSLVSEPKISVEQIMRLNEDKIFDYQLASKDFAYQPLTFEQGLQRLFAEDCTPSI